MFERIVFRPENPNSFVVFYKNIRYHLSIESGKWVMRYGHVLLHPEEQATHELYPSLAETQAALVYWFAQRDLHLVFQK